MQYKLYMALDPVDCETNKQKIIRNQKPKNVTMPLDCFSFTLNVVDVRCFCLFFLHFIFLFVWLLLVVRPPLLSFTLNCYFACIPNKENVSALHSLHPKHRSPSAWYTLLKYLFLSVLLHENSK